MKRLDSSASKGNGQIVHYKRGDVYLDRARFKICHPWLGTEIVMNSDQALSLDFVNRDQILGCIMYSAHKGDIFRLHSNRMVKMGDKA